jgi:hypothetical protein
MNSKRNLTAVLVLSIILFPLTTFAEILFLQTGKELEVEKTWQENDLICFDFHGIDACLPPAKVVRIDRTTKYRSQTSAGKNGKKADLKKINRQAEKDVSPDQIKPGAQTFSATQQMTIPSEQISVLRKDGFHDLPWGIEVSKVDGLKRRYSFSDSDEVIEYVRPKDILKIGDARLRHIIYNFWRDRLYTVTIWARDYSNYTALRDGVIEQFGKSRLSDPSQERYLWSSTFTDLMLEYDKNTELGMLWLRSSEMDRNYKMSQMKGPASLLKWMKSRK